MIAGLVPGRMFHNGAALCGGCGDYTVGSCAGGRTARKAEGWFYSGRHNVGWVCSTCSRWARAAVRLSRTPKAPTPASGVPTVAQDGLTTVGNRGSARGFGAHPLSAKRINRSKARKAKLRERRADNRAAGRPSSVPDLDALSPSAYRDYWRAVRAREKRKKR